MTQPQPKQHSLPTPTKAKPGLESLLKSDNVSDRLRKALTPEEVIEAIRAGQEVGTDQGVQVDKPVLVQA